MGIVPRLRLPISINRWMRDSSIVDLVPSLTAHRCWINESSCSVNAINCGSPLASASVGLPVVLLIFISGSTPKSRNTLANWGLLASFLRTASSSSHSNLSLRDESNSCFSLFNAFKRSYNTGSSIINLGCVNIRSVIFIRSSSDSGMAGTSLKNKS